MDKFLYYFIRNSYTIMFNSFHLHLKVLLNSLEVVLPDQKNLNNNKESNKNSDIKELFNDKIVDLIEMIAEDLKGVKDNNEDIKMNDFLYNIQKINNVLDEVREFYARNYDYANNLFQKHRLRRIVHNDTTLRKTSQKNILFFEDMTNAYIQLLGKPANTDYNQIVYFNNKDKAIKYKLYGKNNGNQYGEKNNRNLLYLTNPSFSEQFSLLSVSMIGHEIYHIANNKENNNDSNNNIEELLNLIKDMTRAMSFYCVTPILNTYEFGVLFDITEEIEADFFAYVSTGPAYLLSLFIVILKQYMFVDYDKYDKEIEIPFLLIRLQILRLLIFVSIIENVFMYNKYNVIIDEIKSFVIKIFHNINKQEIEEYERINIITRINESAKNFSVELKNYFKDTESIKTHNKSDNKESGLIKFIWGEGDKCDNEILSFTVPPLLKKEQFYGDYEKNNILLTPSFILHNIIYEYNEKDKENKNNNDKNPKWSAGRVIRKMRLWQQWGEISKYDSEHNFKYNFYKNNIIFGALWDKTDEENNISNNKNNNNDKEEFIEFICSQKWEPKLFVFKNKLMISSKDNNKEGNNNKSFLTFLFADLLMEYGDIPTKQENTGTQNGKNGYYIIGDYNDIVEVKHSSREYLELASKFEKNFINNIINDNKDNENETSKLYILLKIGKFKNKQDNNNSNNDNKNENKSRTIGNIFNDYFKNNKTNIKYIKVYKCMGNEDLLYEFGINEKYFSTIQKILTIFRKEIEGIEYTKTYFKINDECFKTCQNYSDLILRIKIVINREDGENNLSKIVSNIKEKLKDIMETIDMLYVAGDYDINIDLENKKIACFPQIYEILKKYSMYINTKLLIGDSDNEKKN